MSPSTTSPLVCEASIFSHAWSISALRRDKINWPSLSSTRSRNTSTSSPGAMLSSCLLLNSLTATIPSDLNPISITTYFSSIEMIRPVTISFSSISLRVFSYIPMSWLYSSSLYSSDGFSSWSNVNTSPSTSPLNTWANTVSVSPTRGFSSNSSSLAISGVDSVATSFDSVASTCAMVSTVSVASTCAMVSTVSVASTTSSIGVVVSVSSTDDLLSSDIEIFVNVHTSKSTFDFGIKL